MQAAQLHRRLFRIGLLLMCLCGIVLSLKVLREPDLWWQLLTGEWMWQNGQLTRTDPFSWTHAGVEWINVKWGFEMLMYFFASIGGPEFIPLMQAIVTPLLLASMLYAALTYRDSEEGRPIALMLVFALIFGMAFRINSRPEMASHLLTAVLFLLLLRWWKKGGKEIWLIVPLQLVWTNLHEAFGTGMIVITAFSLAQWKAWFFGYEKRSKEELKQLGFASLAAIAAVCINPNGPRMLLHPFNILGQVYSNKFTTELFGFDNPRYWQFESYLALIVFALILSSWVASILAEKGDWKSRIRSFHSAYNLGYVGLLLAFYYLALTAYRNIPFFLIVSLPGFLAAELYWKNRLKVRLPQTAMYAVAIVLFIGLYISIPTNLFYKQFDPKNQYGLEVSSIDNPVGVASWMAAENVSGTGFTDYLCSAFLMYALRPDYKSYIDLRDLDIFSAEFFDDYQQIINDPRRFREAQDSFNFDYVVLYRPRNEALHKYLVNFSEFTPVYADAVAVLYLPKDQVREDLIFQPNTDSLFQMVKPVESSGIAKAVSKLFWPFHKAKEYPEMEQHLAAAAYHNTIADPNVAAQRAATVIEGPEEFRARGHEMLASVFYQSGINQQTPERQAEFLNNALKNYREALKLGESVSAFSGMATTQLRLGNLRDAERRFLEALQLDPNDLSSLLGLVECSRRLVQQQPNKAELEREKRIAYLIRAGKLEPGNTYVRSSLGFEYCALNDCENTRKFLSDVEAESLQPEDRDALQSCLQRCP